MFIFLLILCVYIPPNVCTDVFLIYIECMKWILSADISTTSLVFGDFNLPLITWSNPCAYSNTKESEFVKFCECFGLHQVNEFPTRGQSLLDLILTNDPLIMSEINLKSVLALVIMTA